MSSQTTITNNREGCQKHAAQVWGSVTTVASRGWSSNKGHLTAVWNVGLLWRLSAKETPYHSTPQCS